MANNKQKPHRIRAQRRKRQLREHIQALNLDNDAGYLEWCAQHGFRVTLNKSTLNLRHERRYYYENSAFSQLKRARVRRQYAQTVTDFCYDHTALVSIRDGDDELAIYACQQILKKIRTAKGRVVMGELLSVVNARTGLLSVQPGRDSHPFIDGLIAIGRYQDLWVRSLDSWKPLTHSPQRQFTSLLRHLLTRYPMPVFFDSVWFDISTLARRCQRWYVQIALGQNPRLAESPVPLTSKMAHHFLLAPPDSSVIQAIRYAQNLALGGDRILFLAMRNSRIGFTLKHNEFWLSVLRFFIAHPMLDRSHFGPICDYLHHQKFEQQVVLIDDYDERIVPPPQPNLNMKGRTPQALLAQVQRWHRLLGRGDKLEKVSWKPTQIKPLHLISGKSRKTVVWKITELLSHQALAREGTAMDHCVVTYSRSCVSRQCSIWSMTSEDVSGHIRRRQTIEVRKGKIVQSRGYQNNDPDNRERETLYRWAREAELTVDLPEYN